MEQKLNLNSRQKMFNDGFYPTPREIGSQMIEPYLDKIKKGAMILDPSAGKGNLLDVCRSAGAKPQNLFAIEIEQDLCSILSEKQYRVIGKDFLRYKSNYLFDLILMNPPFSNGEEHLLAAWDILREGDIVCLLNSASIKNINTHRRELLQTVIENNGETIDLGQCFKSAERPTGVDVTMIRLRKQKEQTLFSFDGLKTNKSAVPEFDGNGIDLDNQIARSNLIEAMVDTYDQIGDALENYIVARNKLSFYVNAIKPPNYHVENTSTKARGYCDGSERQKDMAEYNTYLDWVKGAAWQSIFDRTKLRTILTKKVREDFEKFQKEQGAVEFTVENIESLFEMLFMNRNEILGKAIVEVFDKMCAYDEKNKIHWEGWKTNSRWKVNKKVIMPYFIYFDIWDKYKRNGKFSIHWSNCDFLDDIDRSLCMITGKKFEEIKPIRESLDFRFKEIGYIGPNAEFDNVVHSEFFEIRFWKKGTLHFIFNDDFIWAEFNRRAAEGKNWLGDGE